MRYTLTELGCSLKPILDAMDAWGSEYKAKMRNSGKLLPERAGKKFLPDRFSCGMIGRDRKEKGANTMSFFHHQGEEAFPGPLPPMSGLDYQSVMKFWICGGALRGGRAEPGPGL